MSEMMLTGKVALVTGAGRGIGRAIALTLARNGAAVAIAARTKAELYSVQKEIDALGGQVLVSPTDMADEAQIISTLRNTVERFGRLDIVVNNAGIGSSKSVAELPTTEWDQVMAVNARGPFVLCREAISYLKQHQQGFIINIISIGARRCYVNSAAYAASKHALRCLSIILSQELKDTGIRVHAINPGGVETPMMAKGIVNRPDLKGARMVQPQEIADIILYLVTHGDGGVIDEISIRRADSAYWCYL
jgi:NAD(P)-dependent dehydrogenase (short-subunit alcohol dehydrogenase family)